MRHEVEYVRRDHLDRVPVDHRVERLQVMGDRPLRAFVHDQRMTLCGPGAFDTSLARHVLG
jgi:hypothetical protein